MYYSDEVIYSDPCGFTEKSLPSFISVTQPFLGTRWNGQAPEIPSQVIALLGQPAGSLTLASSSVGCAMENSDLCLSHCVFECLGLKTVAIISQGHIKTLAHLPLHLKLQCNLKHQNDTEGRDGEPPWLRRGSPLPPNPHSLRHSCCFVEN